jgi:hypothetical protein
VSEKKFNGLLLGISRILKTQGIWQFTQLQCCVARDRPSGRWSPANLHYSPYPLLRRPFCRSSAPISRCYLGHTYCSFKVSPLRKNHFGLLRSQNFQFFKGTTSKSYKRRVQVPKPGRLTPTQSANQYMTTMYSYTYNITAYPSLDSQIVTSKPEASKQKIGEVGQKRVLFYAKVEVYDHIHHKHMDDEEHIAYWFQGYEYDVRRAECEKTVARMEKAKAPLLDDDDFCSRGLERSTKAGRCQLTKNRTESYAIVNYEQNRQWSDVHRTSLDANALARAYRSTTKNAALVARRTGISDEEYVLGAYFPGMNVKEASHKTNPTYFFGFSTFTRTSAVSVMRANASSHRRLNIE